jgi:hypothetical protein
LKPHHSLCIPCIIKEVLMLIFEFQVFMQWNVFIYRYINLHTHTHTHTHKDWTVTKTVHLLSHKQATLLRIIIIIICSSSIIISFILATCIYNLPPACTMYSFSVEILNSGICYSRYRLQFHVSRYVISFVMLLQPASKWRSLFKLNTTWYFSYIFIPSISGINKIKILTWKKKFLFFYKIFTSNALKSRRN